MAKIEATVAYSVNVIIEDSNHTELNDELENEILNIADEILETSSLKPIIIELFVNDKEIDVE